MIVKVCRKPQGGGSARGAVRYILGYELGVKADAIQQRESYHALMSEAMTRDDFGVGVVWQPAVGDGVRPSSVYAHGLTSLASADAEMEGVSRCSPRVQSPVHHLVLSFGHDDPNIGDETIIEAARRVLGKCWDEDSTQYVLAVHRDTDQIHVHAAIGAVSTSTLTAHEMHRSHRRLHWAAREVELEMGLVRDRGLAVVRNEKVEWATVAERQAWKRDEIENRVDDLLIRAQGDYEAFESPQSWVTQVLEPRLGAVMQRAQERNEPIFAADLHAVTATYGARLERDAHGNLFAVLRERIPEDERVGHSVGEADPAGERTRRVARSRDAKESFLRLDLEATAGHSTVVPGDSPQVKFNKEAPRLERLEALNNLSSIENAEAQLVAHIKVDPDYVVRNIVGDGNSCFTRSAIDAYLARRLTMPDEIEDLSEHIESKAKELKPVLSLDTANPLYTTTTVLLIEKRVQAAATRLAESQDVAFDPEALQEAIANVESERGFSLSDEQRAMLFALDKRLSWNNGEAGSGKTTGMAVLNEYAKITKREICGLTLAQAAAERLQIEAGFHSVNSARAIVQEELGEKIIPENGIIVLDETSMTSYEDIDSIFRLAEQRNCTVIGIGDAGQLQNLDFGSPHATCKEVAEAAGTYHELRKVVRQEQQWHRDLVADLGQAIREIDQGGVERAVNTYGEKKIVEFGEDRDATIVRAAEWYVDSIRKYGAKETLLLAGDKMTARHLNQTIRQSLGLAGTGRSFKTDHGVREIAIGDRLVATKNAKRVGLMNGDMGTVSDLGYDEKKKCALVTLILDSGRSVAFDPSAYRSFEHGYAVSMHKAQGASVLASGCVIDKSCSAEMLHVAASRAKRETKLFVAATNFPDIQELAVGISQKIQGKDDALLFQRIVEKTGGKDTVWALRCREAQSDWNDPLRAQHRAEMAGMQTEYARQVSSVHAAFKQRQVEAKTPEERRTNAGAHRSIVANLEKQFAPTSFEKWSIDHKREIETGITREAQYRRATNLRVRNVREQAKREPQREQHIHEPERDLRLVEIERALLKAHKPVPEQSPDQQIGY